MEKAGARRWPFCGAVYLVHAIKRVHGMRMIGLSKNARVAGSKAPAVALNNHHNKK